MSDVNMGTMYELNKSVMRQQKPMSKTDLKDKIKEIKQFFLNNKDKYFMLLNRETYNFTLFNLGNKDDITMQRIMKDFKLCLVNRGNVLSADLTESKDAYEIWISADDEPLVYYLFPYDLGVIE
jgi:hypothetical protein